MLAKEKFCGSPRTHVSLATTGLPSTEGGSQGVLDSNGKVACLTSFTSFVTKVNIYHFMPGLAQQMEWASMSGRLRA